MIAQKIKYLGSYGEAMKFTDNQEDDTYFVLWVSRRITEVFGTEPGFLLKKNLLTAAFDIQFILNASTLIVRKNEWFLILDDCGPIVMPDERFVKEVTFVTNTREPEADVAEVQMTGGFGFAAALIHLEDGGRVARAGWRKNGLWVMLINGTDVSDSDRDIDYILRDDDATDLIDHTHGLKLLSWFGIKTADDCFVPWLPTQVDMLAKDWCSL